MSAKHLEIEPMKDISIDLETLGIDSAAMILSISAVKFDRNTYETGEYFNRVIDIEAPGGGGVIDASTVVWWMNQPEDARAVLFSKDAEYKDLRTPLRQALAEFSEFIGFDGNLPDGEYPKVTLWQRGDKDAQWLTSAYQGMQLELPFRYWQVENQRTLCNLFKPFMPDRPVGSVAHDSLSDAFYQAHCLCAAFARLNSVGAILRDPPSPAEMKERAASALSAAVVGFTDVARDVAKKAE